MVELCKERVGLLVDGENEDRRLETWHCRCVVHDAVQRQGKTEGGMLVATADSQVQGSAASTAGSSTGDVSLRAEGDARARHVVCLSSCCLL
jgi:hypothetical protein